jgi:2,4-dienoyl-CoA reductase (NADPH2)
VLDDGFGWWPGVSVVEAALAAGAQEVTFISPGTGFAGMLSVENRTQLLGRLASAPLRVIPLSTVTRTSDTQVHLASVLDGNENTLPADVLVVVGERRAGTVDLEPVDGQTVLAVGDCVVPRRMSHAVAEGRAAARAILTRV